MTKLTKRFRIATSVLGFALGAARQAEASLVFDESAGLQNYTVMANSKHLIGADVARGAVSTGTTFVDGEGTVVERVLILRVGDLLQVDVGGRGIEPNRSDSLVVAALDNVEWSAGDRGRLRGGVTLHGTDGLLSGLATPGSNGAFWSERGQSGLNSLVVAQANSLRGTSASGGGSGGGGSSSSGSSTVGKGGGVGRAGVAQGGGGPRLGDPSNDTVPKGTGGSSNSQPGGHAAGNETASEGGGIDDGSEPGRGTGEGGWTPGGGDWLDPGANSPGESGGPPGNGPDSSLPPIHEVPEPSTLVPGVMGAGLVLGYAWVRRRRDCDA